MKRIIYFSFTKKEKEEKKKMAQSSPRSTWWWIGSGWRRKRRNWSGCLRLRPSFYFRVASATTYPSQYVMPYRAQSFFLFSPDGHFTQKIIISPRLAFSNGWNQSNLFTSEVLGIAEECRMVTSFACKENWVEREREFRPVFMNGTAAGEARKSGLLLARKKKEIRKAIAFFQTHKV